MPRFGSRALGDSAAESADFAERISQGPKLGFNPLRNGSSSSVRPKPLAAAGGSVDKPDVGHDKKSEEKFDPVKENGPIFVDWPKPKLALVITGRQDGYLEPCGCAGLERMKGGLNRRHSMIEQLRNTWRWPVVAVDVGGLVSGFGPQADLKFQTTVNAMQIMKYDAIALGKSELQFDVGVLISPGTGDENPFISSNAALLGFEFGLTDQERVIEAGGMKVGVTSALGKKWHKEVKGEDVKLADPEEKLAELAPALKEECDVVILLAHATTDETLELAKKFPQFDVVVTAGGPPEPPDEPNPIEGSKAMLIEVGQQGTYAVVLGLFDDPARPVRYQRVPLDSRFRHSKEMKELMAGYQDQLKALWLEDLKLPTVPLPGKELLGRFVGSEKCLSCHEESYKVWKKSGHAKAWPTLVKQDPPRDYDPECVSCHVVGWHPQYHAPYETGFLSQKETPHLVHVGCETCHGPGEKHVEAEASSDLALQQKLRKALVITLEESQEAVSRAASDQQPCMNCHDLENSPDFNFKTYWPKIEHREE